MPLTVFVTGADKGLGLAFVQKFACEGYRVFAGYVGDGASLRALAERSGGAIIPIPQDVADLASVGRSAALVAGQVDSLDVLVNNAAVCLDYKARLADLDFANGSFERSMAVNAFGPLRVLQAFLPVLERGTRKLVMSVSSEAGSIGELWRDFGYTYCMSKAALNMAMAIAQRDLKDKGFKVLLFHPGWLRTDMGAPEAHLAPEESASLLYDLAMRPWAQDDPMYMDYNGRVMAW